MGMRCNAALLAIAAATLGCNTRQRVAGAGAGMSFVGLTLTYSNDPQEEVGTQGEVGIALMLTGLVVLFVAAALDEVAAKEAATAPPKPRARPVPIARGDTPELRAMKKREEAWGHTKAAQQAARDGDCAKVTELSAKVGAIDAEFYADVFMKDVAIQRCFVPVEPKPATAPVPPPIPPSTN